MLRNIIKDILVSFLLILSIGCFGQKSSYTIKKIVIDAGHGGKDPGATIGKTFEKDIALSVALRTGRMIKKQFPEVVIIYTRDKDVFIPLDERAEIANKHKADLFISIHVNICSTARTSGVETYVLGQYKSRENLEVAKLENSVILLEDDYNTKYEGFDPNSSESYIMFELMQNEYLEQSRLFASEIQNSIISNTEHKDRGVRQAGFLVLRKTAMPSVLIELGFMSNKTERDFMERDQGRNLLAESIAKAFCSYKTRIDRIEKTDSIRNENKPKEIIIKDDSLFDISLLKGKWYGTQILATKYKLKVNNKLFKNQKPIYFLFENGLYKYFVGLTQDSREAIKLYNDYKVIYKEPFMVSLEDGMKKKFK